MFAVRTSAGRAQVIVTAQISGGRPHASYDLAGSDCTGHGPDAVWAAGVTDGHGSADLTGSSREVVVSYEYFMVLDTPDLFAHVWSDGQPHRIGRGGPPCSDVPGHGSTDGFELRHCELVTAL